MRRSPLMASLMGRGSPHQGLLRHNDHNPGTARQTKRKGKRKGSSSSSSTGAHVLPRKKGDPSSKRSAERIEFLQLPNKTEQASEWKKRYGLKVSDTNVTSITEGHNAIDYEKYLESFTVASDNGFESHAKQHLESINWEDLKMDAPKIIVIDDKTKLTDIDYNFNQHTIEIGRQVADNPSITDMVTAVNNAVQAHLFKEFKDKRHNTNPEALADILTRTKYVNNAIWEELLYTMFKAGVDWQEVPDQAQGNTVFLESNPPVARQGEQTQHDADGERYQKFKATKQDEQANEGLEALSIGEDSLNTILQNSPYNGSKLENKIYSMINDVIANSKDEIPLLDSKNKQHKMTTIDEIKGTGTVENEFVKLVRKELQSLLSTKDNVKQERRISYWVEVLTALEGVAKKQEDKFANKPEAKQKWKEIGEMFNSKAREAEKLNEANNGPEKQMASGERPKIDRGATWPFEKFKDDSDSDSSSDTSSKHTDNSDKPIVAKRQLGITRFHENVRMLHESLRIEFKYYKKLNAQARDKAVKRIVEKLQLVTKFHETALSVGLRLSAHYINNTALDFYRNMPREVSLAQVSALFRELDENYRDQNLTAEGFQSEQETIPVEAKYMAQFKRLFP